MLQIRSVQGEKWHTTFHHISMGKPWCWWCKMLIFSKQTWFLPIFGQKQKTDMLELEWFRPWFKLKLKVSFGKVQKYKKNHTCSGILCFFGVCYCLFMHFGNNISVSRSFGLQNGCWYDNPWWILPAFSENGPTLCKYTLKKKRY